MPLPLLIIPPDSRESISIDCSKQLSSLLYWYRFQHLLDARAALDFNALLLDLLTLAIIRHREAANGSLLAATRQFDFPNSPLAQPAREKNSTCEVYFFEAGHIIRRRFAG